MPTLPLTPEIRELASRVMWFEPAEKAIAILPRFLAYTMTYGSYADVSLLRQYLSESELREAMSEAPPGIFDARSWAYWHLKLDCYPAPPLPERRIELQT